MMMMVYESVVYKWPRRHGTGCLHFSSSDRLCRCRCLHPTD